MRTTEDLLTIRARQLEKREEDLKEARARLKRKRLENKEAFNATKNIRHDKILPGDVVLIYDTQHKKDMSRGRKLKYK